MNHVSILPLYNATLASIDSSHQLFSRVNDFLNYQGKAPFYKVEIVGVEKQIQLNNGLYRVQADTTIDARAQTDLIVIPLLCGDFPEAISKNRAYVDWVISQYHRHAEIVCLCVGSFFLASTGLLNDKKCAVHWAAKSEFNAMFPDIKIIDDKIITDENGIYTCGGGFSYLNLLLYLIEKKVGREIAILASKMFEIDIARKSQNPYVIFTGQRQHGDPIILKAQDHIESQPTETFSIEEMCRSFGLGRRTFERRFKKHTGNSIVEYIQRVKVEFAKAQLEEGRKTVSEITYETGYNDIDTFRKIFKKYTDLSPVDYRKKYTFGKM